MGKIKVDSETLKNSWEIHKKIINKFLSEEREEKVLKMIDNLGENYLLSPASSKEWFHNAFPGGYLDHINRVVKFSVKQYETFQDLGIELNFTLEELVFTALFHKLGKIGEKDKPLFIPQENEWRRNNLQEEYEINPELDFMTVADRTFYLLQFYKIQVTKNEYLGIRLYNGLYEDANKSYMFSRDENSKIRTELPFLIHTAEKMAQIFEYQNYKKA